MSRNLSVVLPCLNEELTIANCIQEIQNAARRDDLNVEIIVADNSSTDSSVTIAKELGAKVIHVDTKGYGATLKAGIQTAKNEIIVMADSDMSYNFMDLSRFYDKMALENLDIVIGNRFSGKIHNGAMPKLHKYIGNPVLSLIGRVLFRIPIKDFHCGMRAVRKSSFMRVNPVTTGMEFATEMIARFSIENMKFGEIPTDLRKDGRDRRPHLRSFPDGWRHLKMMLLYSPEWLQIIPGSIVSLLSLAGILDFFITGKVHLIFATGSIQASIICLLGFLVGIQMVVSGLTASCIAYQKGVTKYEGWQKFESVATSPWCTSFGVVISAIGGLSIFVDMGMWIRSNFNSVDVYSQTRVTVLSAAMFFLGTSLITLTVQIRQLTSKFW